jgi:hypothetical protein
LHVMCCFFLGFQDPSLSACSSHTSAARLKTKRMQSCYDAYPLFVICHLVLFHRLLVAIYWFHNCTVFRR